MLSPQASAADDAAHAQDRVSSRRRRRPERRILVDEVQESVLGLLMDGLLPPGEAVNIDELARSLEVSSTPVREALGRLEVTGLLHRVALKGYRVAPPLSLEEFAQLIDARLAIEPLAASRVGRYRDPVLLDELRRAHATQLAVPVGAQHTAYRGYRDYLSADRKFHELINSGAGNSFLASSFNAMNGHVQRFRLYHDHIVDDAPETLAEHSAILAAVEQGMARAARTAMQLHLKALLKRATGWSGPSALE